MAASCANAIKNEVYIMTELFIVTIPQRLNALFCINKTIFDFKLILCIFYSPKALNTTEPATNRRKVNIWVLQAALEFPIKVL